MRKYLPLLLVLGRKVPSTQEGNTSAIVYDVLFNLLLDRDMRLASETELSVSYPAGKVMMGDEALKNSLGSDHINCCVPAEPNENVAKSNMRGTLSRPSPFFGIDGVESRFFGRKEYINDVAACEIDGTPYPCGILELYWDGEGGQVMVGIRLFRAAVEVRDVGAEERRTGLLRLWQETPSKGGTARIPPTAILDLCEIYTVGETLAGQHRGGWGHGVRS